MPRLLDRVLGRADLPLEPVVSSRSTVPSERYNDERTGEPRGPVGLTAAAATVTPSQAKALGKARQKWQRDAWVYRDAIGEVRFGTQFLANCASLITLQAAAVGPDGEEPIDLDAVEEHGLDAQIVADARALVDDLTGGRGGGHLLAPGVENLETAGECYLLGRTLFLYGEEQREWSIRSVDEVEVKPDGVYLRTGEKGKGEKLAEGTYELIRLWKPHPRFTEWADSPMRALLDPCEELLLIARMVRAAARNRIAGNGILLLSSGLARDAVSQGRNGDGTTVAEDLQRAFVTPIGDESSTSAVVPPILWGEPADLTASRHLTLDRPLDAGLAAREEKALKRIAAGLDLPAEVISGVADLNHWTAWQVDESSFRHHVSPIVGVLVDAMTVGWFRAKLVEMGHSAAAARRLMLWRNPARLVQKPNRGSDAVLAYDRNELSGDALLEALGFDPSDKPDEEELLQRLALKRGSIDSAITEALLRLGFGNLVDVLRTTADGQVTLRTGELAQDLPLRALPAGDPPPASTDEQTPADDQPATGDATDDGVPGDAITAAGEPDDREVHRTLSRRLARIDRTLRDRLQAAAEAELVRALERAGNRTRSKAVTASAETRQAVQGVPGHLVASTLGRDVVTASLGLEETELLADAFARLHAVWDELTIDAAEQAFDVVAELLGVPRESEQVRRAVAELRDSLDEYRAEGWALLEEGLQAEAAEALYEPDPDTSSRRGENTEARVRPGLIRGALAVAGGLPSELGGLLPNGLPAVPGTPLGGIATGTLVDRYLHGQGAEVVEYEWTYGISTNEFRPHKRLDGAILSGYDDPQLATPADYSWIGPLFLPGDHDGCHCDLAVIYSTGVNTRDAAAAIGDDSFRRQNPDRANTPAATTVLPGR